MISLTGLGVSYKAFFLPFDVTVICSCVHIDCLKQTKNHKKNLKKPKPKNWPVPLAPIGNWKTYILKTHRHVMKLGLVSGRHA